MEIGGFFTTPEPGYFGSEQASRVREEPNPNLNGLATHTPSPAQPTRPTNTMKSGLSAAQHQHRPETQGFLPSLDLHAAASSSYLVQTNHRSVVAGSAFGEPQLCPPRRASGGRFFLDPGIGKSTRSGPLPLRSLVLRVPHARPAVATVRHGLRSATVQVSHCTLISSAEHAYRHLMQNVVSLLPHAKKDSKVESKQSKGSALNELVELRSCSSCLFFECRKQKDLYLWMVKSPAGPSVKFLVNAVHTMEELRLTGNHLKGSRPLLTFSSNFDQQPHWKLLKEMITQIFATPKDHRKAKPFHDHVFVFSIVDDHIWFRNYQISVPHNEIDKVDKGGLDKMTLVEVGPRFCLNPIKIFGGSFGGPTLFENPFYVSPNQISAIVWLVSFCGSGEKDLQLTRVCIFMYALTCTDPHPGVNNGFIDLEHQIRALEKRKKAGKYAKKVKAKVRRKMHEMENTLEPDEFADLWKGED
ncbi:unnamed protein product [Triticum turgidum subsp. durum]|uniref:Brix domain-containing protein n=1 Tax=Triticum turgidum subsp. durum TaxID=4567 RepID=A0A9R1P450_TRITD|nr:unnamed protein product [Triticum turgidum subsp. durum]